MPLASRRVPPSAMSGPVLKNAVSRREETCAAMTACAMPMRAPACWARSAVMPKAADSSPMVMASSKARRAPTQVTTAMSASGRLARRPCTHESAVATP